MKFAERLDWIMNFTATTNAALARSAIVDTSQISRLRRGNRRASRETGYLRLMARCLAERCIEQKHLPVLVSLIGIDRPVSEVDVETLTDALIDWLLSEKDDSGEIRDRLEEMETGKKDEARMPASEAPVRIYFGNSGRRAALLDFTEHLLAKKRGYLLKSAPDEPVGWMSESEEFTRKMADNMKRMSELGSRHLFIQPSFRSLDFSLDNIYKTLSIYATGDVKLYHYPRSRDNVHHRTLILAQGEIALTGVSVASEEKCGVTFLVTDKQAVEALDKEFDSYMALCRSSIRTYSVLTQNVFQHRLEDCFFARGDLIQKSDTLTYTSMPSEVLDSVCRAIYPALAEVIMTQYEHCRKGFIDNLSENICVDMMYLPTKSEMLEGKVKNPWTPLLGIEQPPYTAEEYRKHLLGIVELLQEYPNYHVFLLDARDDVSESDMFVKAGQSVMFFKRIHPLSVLEIHEKDMVTAFWDYLQQTEIMRRREDREGTIARLRALAAKL